MRELVRGACACVRYVRPFVRSCRVRAAVRGGWPRLAAAAAEAPCGNSNLLRVWRARCKWLAASATKQGPENGTRVAFLDRYYDTVLQGLLTLDTGTIDGRGVAVGMGSWAD